MLTPRFDISQDHNSLKIVIKAPNARVSETEVYFEDTEFKFYSKPYYLRLNLPGKVVENGREKATYDADNGTFTVVVPKECPGEHFDGLDLLTKLLAPKGARSASGPGVEVLETDKEDAVEEEEEEIDFHVEQVPWWENQPQSEVQSGMKYGFANRRSDVFSKLQEELQDVVDVREPDRLTPAECSEARRAGEQRQFDPDHYLADLYEDDMILELLKYQSPWVKELQKATKCPKAGGADTKDRPEEDILVFNEEEKEQLLRLPKREYLLDEETVPVVCFVLVDILFAYAYNQRSTEGEGNVESAWTICKLSTTLSWLESFSSLREAVLSSCRRSLCFPLYRSWALTMAVLQDTKDIVSAGRRHILRCLLHIHRLLSADENKYLLNDLYITDYGVWVQTAGHKVFSSLAQALSQIQLSKADMNLELEELEHAARLVQMEEEEESQVVDPLKHLSLQEPAAQDRCTTAAGALAAHAARLVQMEEEEESQVIDPLKQLSLQEPGAKNRGTSELEAPVAEMGRLSLSSNVDSGTHLLTSGELKEDSLPESDSDSDDSNTSSWTGTESSFDSGTDSDDEVTVVDKALSKNLEVPATSKNTSDKEDVQCETDCRPLVTTSACGDKTVPATSESTGDKDAQAESSGETLDATSDCGDQREEKQQKHSWLETPDMQDRYRIVEEGRHSDTIDRSVVFSHEDLSDERQLITELDET